MSPAIEVSGLTVRYGALVAVDDLDLEADAGQVVALLGPNGAGKTSTVETLEGYRARSGGSVSILGLDPSRDHRTLTRHVGVMLQQGGVHPGMSPSEALQLYSAFYDHPVEPAALIDELGLGPASRTSWRRLSGGEQRRLSLALALVGRPRVAFLDEPTAGVDPQGRLVIRRVVAGLRDEGVCVVLTTHELEEAERLADRVIIVDRGRVVAAGTPAQLMTQSAGKVIRFGAPPGLDVAGLADRLGGGVTEERPGEYVVAAEATPARVAALTAWLAERDLPLADLRAGRERLEDVFLRLTGDDGGGCSRPAGGDRDPDAVHRSLPGRDGSAGGRRRRRARP